MTPTRSGGHSLIEMVIVIAIASVLLALAASNYREWMANSQIRTAAETLVEGLSAARSEAIRRNQTISFRLMNNLSGKCEESATGGSWVVSVEDPGEKCNQEISETELPMIVAKKAGSERTATVTIAATAGDDSDASSVAFNGVGRVITGGKPIARIAVDSSVLEADKSRDLRVIVSPGGMIRMCDPDSRVGDEDPRKCP